MEKISITPATTDTGVIETSALVIGAGPVGLFQVFQLGLQGIGAHVVDVLGEPGGQCTALYPDKPIYDIPGLVRCTGRELIKALMQQVEPFYPTFHFRQQVHEIERHANGKWWVATPQQRFLTKTLLIAAGVGAFVPKELKVDSLAAFVGTQVHYPSDTLVSAPGQDVVVVGGEQSAVQLAVELAGSCPQNAKSVTLIHRRDALQASPHCLAQLVALRQCGRIQFIAGQVTGTQINGQRLTAIEVTTPEGAQRVCPLDSLWVCQGLSPRLGPIARWGMAMERKQLVVNPATFATSEAGIFAVGDINTYPGKKKLIVCGFHEATLAAFAAAHYMDPAATQPLQYTTSSAVLQGRLGVSLSVN